MVFNIIAAEISKVAGQATQQGVQALALPIVVGGVALVLAVALATGGRR